MTRKSPPRPEIDSIAPADLPPIGLPRPRLRGTVPLEACIRARRSTRQFSNAALSVADVAQLLWAGQGVTGLGGLRTAPSAGALYPYRVYLAASRVRGLPQGLFKYDADEHYIRYLVAGDFRPSLIELGLDACIQDVPAIIVLAADYRRAAREFRQNAARLVHIEAGHIGQNICLEAAALGLGVIGLGAVDPEAVRKALHIREHEEPAYLLAVGKKLDAEPLV